MKTLAWVLVILNQSQVVMVTDGELCYIQVYRSATMYSEKKVK